MFSLAKFAIEYISFKACSIATDGVCKNLSSMKETSSNASSLSLILFVTKFTNGSSTNNKANV